MRIVFMGTPSFAVPALCALHKHHEVVGVVTRPDAASKRGKALHPSQVKEAALKLGIPEHDILCTKSLRSNEVQDWLRSRAADLFVVAAYSALLPPEVLEMPVCGCINIHGSLLPAWRGAAPIQRAILAGDKSLGVCIMQMEEGLDTGDYCLSAQTEASDKNAEQLSAELAELGAQKLIEALERMEAGSLVWISQDDAQATYAHKLSKDECFLSPELSAQENLLRLRASSDSAPARLSVGIGGADKSMAVRVLDARECAAPEAGHYQAGDLILSKKGMVLACAGDTDATFLELIAVKPDGKKEMPAKSWCQGLVQQGCSHWSSL